MPGSSLINKYYVLCVLFLIHSFFLRNSIMITSNYDHKVLTMSSCVLNMDFSSPAGFMGRGACHNPYLIYNCGLWCLIHVVWVVKPFLSNFPSPVLSPRSSSFTAPPNTKRRTIMYSGLSLASVPDVPLVCVCVCVLALPLRMLVYLWLQVFGGSVHTPSPHSRWIISAAACDVFSPIAVKPTAKYATCLISEQFAFENLVNFVKYESTWKSLSISR